MGKLERLTDNSGAPQRVYSVDALQAACRAATLTIDVNVSTNSGGWGRPELRRIDLVDGVANYEVVAMGPGSGPVSMMLQIFKFVHEDKDFVGVEAVRVIAASNEMSARVSGC